MRAFADGTDTADRGRLAMLAALNIAHEYHLLKTKLDGGVSHSYMSNHSSERDGWEGKMPEGEETETSGEELRLTQADGNQKC